MACEDKKANLANAKLASNTAMLAVDQAIAIMKSCFEAERQAEIELAICLGVQQPPTPPGP